ncbi:MAG: polymorphic toxin-type HINT domain-containing protein [Aminipila sp.]
MQGTANTVLAIAGSPAIAQNPLQEVTKYVGYKIAGDKGAAAAGKMYGVADFTLGCVSGGGALKYFSKVDKVGDLVNVAGKFTSGAGSLIKGTVNVVKNPGLVAKFMKQASVNSVKTLRYSTTTAASALVSSANKFATNFATTLGRIGQATKAGASEYAAATARLGITPKSPTVEGLTAAISKYKQLASGTDDVIKSGAETFKGLCFTSDTLIPTKDGDKQIKDIKVGDEVYSANPETGEKGLKKVKNIFVKETDTLIHVLVGKEEIRTTKTHPFWVEGEGWVPASELKAGDMLSLFDGKKIKVSKIAVEKLSKPIKVYNFEVEDWHTYYVSDTQILVHNTCSRGGTEASGISRNAAYRAAKRDAGIPNSVQGSKPVKVYDTENRIVQEFDVNGVKKYIVEHQEDSFGRGLHFHGADNLKGSPFEKGRYNQYPGHFPEELKGYIK